MLRNIKITLTAKTSKFSFELNTTDTKHLLQLIYKML